jgi:hypothetical protein
VHEDAVGMFHGSFQDKISNDNDSNEFIFSTNRAAITRIIHRKEFTLSNVVGRAKKINVNRRKRPQ